MAIGIIDDRWAVDGTPIYTPSSSTQISHESIQSSDTGRTEDGVMHIDWVRTNVVKVNMQWDYLTGDEVEHLENLMQGREFTLTYFDKGLKCTASVYVSNMSYTKKSDALYVNEGGLYTNITANAIEI